jgi:hypothetical protein
MIVEMTKWRESSGQEGRTAVPARKSSQELIRGGTRMYAETGDSQTPFDDRSQNWPIRRNLVICFWLD